MNTPSTLTRRDVLGLTAAAIVGGVAGCSQAQPAVSNPTETPSSTTSPEQESQVEVPPCPERPEAFTRDNAMAFATEFEKSWLIRQVISGNDNVYLYVDVDVDIDQESRVVEQLDDGWLVHFTVKGPAARWRPKLGATVTHHNDPMIYGVNYFLSNETVVRGDLNFEVVDPRENGVEVFCPPEKDIY